jgi:hypothetical protein
MHTDVPQAREAEETGLYNEEAAFHGKSQTPCVDAPPQSQIHNCREIHKWALVIDRELLRAFLGYVA